MCWLLPSLFSPVQAACICTLLACLPLLTFLLWYGWNGGDCSVVFPVCIPPMHHEHPISLFLWETGPLTTSREFICGHTSSPIPPRFYLYLEHIGCNLTGSPRGVSWSLKQMSSAPSRAPASHRHGLLPAPFPGSGEPGAPKHQLLGGTRAAFPTTEGSKLQQLIHLTWEACNDAQPTHAGFCTAAAPRKLSERIHLSSDAVYV